MGLVREAAWGGAKREGSVRKKSWSYCGRGLGDDGEEEGELVVGLEVMEEDEGMWEV